MTTCNPKRHPLPGYELLELRWHLQFSRLTSSLRNPFKYNIGEEMEKDI